MARRPTKDDNCPICGSPSAPDTRPFCSPRCRMRDLAHWIGGDEPYVIPGAPIAAGSGLSEEERALLEEAEAEGAPPSGGNVIHADFRRRRRVGQDDDED